MLEQSVRINGAHSERHESVKRAGKRVLRAPGGWARKATDSSPSLQRVLQTLGIKPQRRALEAGKPPQE